MLLCERDDEWVRRAVFDGVTGFFYESTRLVMNVAYKRRGALGERFDELLNLVILWAAVRNGANFVVRDPRGCAETLQRSAFPALPIGTPQGPCDSFSAGAAAGKAAGRSGFEEGALSANS